LSDDAARPVFGISTGARVAEYVRSLVWDGKLRAGDRVAQAEIATALGMSRIPVREGLVALEAEGLVRHEPQRGVFVVGLDRAFVRDHYALLGLVLAHVIEQAVPLAVEFKERVCHAGGSARARAAVGAMERLVPGNLHAQVPEAIGLTRAGVAAIGEAIALGDAVRAAAETRSMTNRLGEAVIRELERRGIIERERAA
jgi:DNA-binding GntR family transcriptional regulator